MHAACVPHPSVVCCRPAAVLCVVMKPTWVVCRGTQLQWRTAGGCCASGAPHATHRGRQHPRLYSPVLGTRRSAAPVLSRGLRASSHPALQHRRACRSAQRRPEWLAGRVPRCGERRTAHTHANAAAAAAAVAPCRRRPRRTERRAVADAAPGRCCRAARSAGPQQRSREPLDAARTAARRHRGRRACGGRAPPAEAAPEQRPRGRSLGPVAGVHAGSAAHAACAACGARLQPRARDSERRGSDHGARRRQHAAPCPAGAADSRAILRAAAAVAPAVA